MRVTVTITKSARPKWLRRGRRHQPYRWTATAANGNTLATSSEAYTNLADIEHAITALFGPATPVRVVTPTGYAWEVR